MSGSLAIAVCLAFHVMLSWRTVTCENNPDVVVKCTFTLNSRPNRRTVCQNGIWPSDNLVNIDPSTEDLSFINIQIYENSIIPPLLHVETLRLDNCRVGNGINGSTKFPLANFSRQVSPNNLKILSISSTNLYSVSKSDFHTGDALQRLILDNCSVQYFHPDTLQAFAGTTNFRFSMSSERYLTTFPWYSLQYVSHSIKELVLVDWPELEMLESVHPNHSVPINLTSGWTLTNMTTLKLRNVKKLSSVPGEVIKTLVRNDCDITFVLNNASCYDCGETVQPLLQWLRVPETKRVLSFGCWDKNISITRIRELMVSDPFCEGLEECISLSTLGEAVITSCVNGTWPGVKNPVVDIDTERLVLDNITTHLMSSLPPIPTVPHLTELHIVACLHKTFDSNSSPFGIGYEPFPLIEFTVNLKNSPVRLLRVEDTWLHSLNYSTFASFSELESLTLKGCYIRDIHLDTFQAFDIIPKPSNRLENTNSLQHFSLENNWVLREFDWNWLAPLETSLKTICLHNNKDLLNIHFANGPSSTFIFRRLQKVSVIGNTVAHDLPLDVLETMNHHFTNTTELNYLSNHNPCSSCGAFPAVAWATASPPLEGSPDMSRTLRYTCLNDTTSSMVYDDRNLQLMLYNNKKDECLGRPSTTTIMFTTSYSDTTTKISSNSFASTVEMSLTSATSDSGGNAPLFIVAGCGGMLCLIGLILVHIRKRRRSEYHRYHDNDVRRWNDKTFERHSEQNTSLADQYFPEESATKKKVTLLVIDSGKLQLTKTVLGRGSQGTIVEGLASGLKYRQGEVTVAVKTFNRETLSSEAIHKMFVEEISAMCHAGFHPNLVNLLGVTTVKKEPALLLEFCEQGSLLTFLEDHRAPFFYSHVYEDGNYLPSGDEVSMEHQAFANQPITEEGDASRARTSNFDGLILSSKDLLSFSYQIARAMEYLAHRTIIHRDLAARNVLVTRNRLVKVSDFGLARKGDNVYVMGSNTGLPVRWMPPEAMLTRCFSQSSDVWSYGVLLWELFSLGEMPYNDFTVLHGQLRNFIKWLQEGHRLARPSGTPTNVYALMTKCWATHPAGRPTFASIRENLDRLISEEVIDQYFQLSTEAYAHLELTSL